MGARHLPRRAPRTRGQPGPVRLLPVAVAQPGERRDGDLGGEEVRHAERGRVGVRTRVFCSACEWCGVALAWAGRV